MEILYLGVTVSLYIPDTLVALVCTVISALVAALGFAIIHSPRLRDLLARMTVYKGRVGYQPDSAVETVALLLALLMIFYNVSTFVFVGGTSGVAQALDTQTPPLLLALANAALNLFVAVLGVGLFIRRNEYQTLERLGLRWPTRGDVVMGLLGGMGLVVIMFAMGTLISRLVPLDVLQQQYQAVDVVNAPLAASILVAFLSAIIYGTTEEILYRGALQPIFGLGLTTLLFVLIHLQYLFTPAMLIILVVGLVLGLLRQRLSTSASILAHIVYNIVPFIVVLALGGHA